MHMSFDNSNPSPGIIPGDFHPKAKRHMNFTDLFFQHTEKLETIPLFNHRELVMEIIINYNQVILRSQ